MQPETDFRFVGLISTLPSIAGLHAVTITILSIFWTFWDPTWLQARSARKIGKTIEFRYKALYTSIQAIAFLTRFSIAIALSVGVLEDPRALRIVCWISLPVFTIVSPPLRSFRVVSDPHDAVITVLSTPARKERLSPSTLILATNSRLSLYSTGGYPPRLALPLALQTSRTLHANPHPSTSKSLHTHSYDSSALRLSIWRTVVPYARHELHACGTGITVDGLDTFCRANSTEGTIIFRSCQADRTRIYHLSTQY